MQTMLDDISAACPGFAISNKISLNWDSDEYRNSKDRKLRSTDSSLTVSLLFQSRGSGNLMDAFYEYNSRSFDPEKIAASCKAVYDAYHTPAELTAGRHFGACPFWLCLIMLSQGSRLHPLLLR